MQTFRLKKGLDVPLQGAPVQEIKPGPDINHVALIGDDYVGFKPTMMVEEGDRIKTGEKLFEDKKNPGVFFTAPGCGKVKEIKRGAKRKFEALVIELEGDEAIDFRGLEGRSPDELSPEDIRQVLQEAGIWTAFRTRPYGRVPGIDTTPASLFVTAIDTEPLASDPSVIISENRDNFRTGLQILGQMLDVPLNLCTAEHTDIPDLSVDGLHRFVFSGPHPAGLPSTHIHFIDPVHAGKQVWHICYQDVIGIGHLFGTGQIRTERIISLAGPGIAEPTLIRTRTGASVRELCKGLLKTDEIYRVISGSVLEGRHAAGIYGFLGRYHRQVTVIHEKNGRGFLNWITPGRDRFSITGLVASSFLPRKKFPMTTAVWGGTRSIFPLGTYEKVMPLDIMPTPLLKSMAVGDTEKSTALGCLELIEEDLALCTFVCPGKNEYGPMLRNILTTIEKETESAGL